MPVAAAQLTFQGLPGDGHRFEEHFQPKRAVTLFNLERLEAFAESAAPFPPGSAGENITLKGLDLQWLSPGARLLIGQAEVQLEKPWKPCHAKNAETGTTLANTENHKGFFASVVREGAIRPGDVVVVIAARGN